VNLKALISKDTFVGIHANQTNIFTGMSLVSALVLPLYPLKPKARTLKGTFVGTHANLINIFIGMDPV